MIAYSWLTFPQHVRDSLEDKFMLVTHFFVMQGKKVET